MLAIAFAAQLGGAGCARAGAWTLGEGETQIIATGGFSDSARAFDTKGRLLPIAAWRKFELGFHIEYGLAESVTVIVNPIFDDVAAAGVFPGAARGFEAVEAGARVRFARLGDAVFSVQALARIPGVHAAVNTAQVGSTAYEAEARLLAGYSFQLFGHAAFADGQIAWRARDGHNPGEARADFTVGVNLLDNLQALIQSFNAATLGMGTLDYPKQRWSKLQPSLVYEFAPGWSAQAGAFMTIAGVNARREQGGLLAVWKKF